MTKTEFLALLEQRLIVLNDEERADLLSEYEQHIDMKVASGLSEAEAIADFGDPEELIKELLDAYHLNTDYQPSGKTSSTSRITYYVKSCAHFLSNTFASLCQMSMKQIFQLCLRLCGMFIFLGAVFMASAVFLSILSGFLYSMPFHSLGRLFYNTIEFFLYLIFLAFSVYMVIFFIKRYILIDYEPLEPPVQNNYNNTYSNYNNEPAFRMEDLHLNEHWDNAKNYAGNVAGQTGEAFARMKQKAAENREHRAAERSTRPPKEPMKIPFPDISLGALCMKIIVWCCKFIAFFFLIGAGLTALFLLASSAAALVFVVTGYKIIGPFLIVLGCALLSMVATGMLMQFVFGGVKE